MTRKRSRFFAPIAWLADRAFNSRRGGALHAVHVALAGSTPPTDLPLLLVANHVSWWDGFLLRSVQQRMRPDAALFTIMLERELKRTPYLAWAGAIGLDPLSIGSLRALLRGVEQLRRERGRRLVVSYFPQGRIWPSSHRPLGFKRGAIAIAARMAPVAVVPVALHLEPLATRAPHAFVYVGEPLVLNHESLDLAEIEQRIAAGLAEIHALLDRQGEDAPTEWERRWPAESTARPDRRA